MANPLLLPLAVLLAFPGIPGLGKFRQKAAAPLDSLPPAWRSAPALGLESSFVRAWLPPLGPAGGLKVQPDLRVQKVSFDPDSGMVRSSVEMNSVVVGQSVSVPVNEFSRELSSRNFERLWRENAAAVLGAQEANQIGGSGSGQGLSFKFPSPLPKKMQSWLGPGGPALTVSGSENIRISGTSQWSNQQIGLLGQSRSLFPSLDMQQDLDIRLEGQLSDRIKVNLLQNSAVQIPLANRIAINYRGDEDDLVQSLDLGNTNLTLPGTQFVSYSGRNEGLFGAKFTTRLGPLDFTMLASKQEGRSERASYSGGTTKQTPSLRDLDYIKGVYFLLYDPNKDFQIIDPQSIQLFLDPGIYQNAIGLVKGRAYLDPNLGALDDTLNASNQPLMVRGNFTPLRPGADLQYEVLFDIYGPNYPVIRLKAPVTGESQILGVSYRYQRADQNGNPVGDFIQVGSPDTLITGAPGGIPDTVQIMKVLRAPLAVLPQDPDKPEWFDQSVPMYQSRELELRNFYNLGGARIDPVTMDLKIRWRDDVPPVYANTVNGISIPLLEAVGLDNLDESTGSGVAGHDGRLDGTRISTATRSFVDYENGILFFPELRPFAPRLGAAAGPFDRGIASFLSRRDSLDGIGARAINAPNPAIYDKRLIRTEDRTFSIDLSFTAQQARGEIMLGRTNIVEGSDVVRVNNQTLVRDRDYRVDYDLGRITMIRQLGPSDQLDIDYAYAPLFSQAGKTLVGSAFRWEGRDKSFGGAFLYESKGAQDLRPRIGEEPSRLLIGDLNTDWRFRPNFLTRLVDMLPGVRTTASSEFNVSAEIGGSMPNPNTKNEVYLDDMEGVRDAVSLAMSGERWRWSSEPLRNSGGIERPISQAPGSGTVNTETHWYTPVTAIKERDLKPTLTNAEGAQNVHSSLAISLPRRPADPATASDSLWAGLTYVLDPVGLDLTRSQFIELWVNDFRDFYNKNLSGVGAVRGRNVKLHVDLGVVSEDQQRVPNIAPNDTLDTEDRNGDNQLSVNTDNEDTGVDGRIDANEPRGVYDLVTVTDADPRGDDFERPNHGGTEYGDLDPRKWRYTNGTEDNHEIVPIPDTEDLNLNSRLDTDNSYFEYTINLGDALSPYLVDSAYVVNGKYENNGDPIPEDNGWRRYRIPIADTLRQVFGRPDLALTRHVRVWIEGMIETDPPSAPPLSVDDGRPFLMLGGLEVVGSRWVLAVPDSNIAQGGTTVTLNALNTLDNPEYVPPFDPGSTRNGSQELGRREQSLVLEFENFGQSDSVETYKTFSIDEDYSRYGTLDWYVTGYQIAGDNPAQTDSLEYFVRFASDERGQNYYEYRALVPVSETGGVNWLETKLPLTNLSNLKLLPDYPQGGQSYFAKPGIHPGETYIINGRPSFTRLRRISFGLVNQRGAENYPRGQVWFNELRAIDVARDPDLASRVQVAGRFANLLNYNVTYNSRGADFQQVGDARGRGSEQSSLAYTLQADLHRFFEATGIVLPVTYNYLGDKTVPRYTAGDDVFRSGAAAEISTTRRITRSFTTSYARSWSDRSNPFLRYTIGGITASYGRTISEGLSPGGADTTTSNAGTINWLIAPRELFSLRMIPTKLRLYPLPERIFWNYRINTSDVHSYYRLQDGTGTLVPSSFSSGRAAFIDFGASTRPFDFIHHEFSATRNQTLPEPLREKIGFINLGRVIGWRQNMDARLAFQKTPQWLRPTLTWSSNYRQDNGPELSPDLSVRTITNGQSISLSMNLPFNTLAPRMASAPPPMVRKVVMRPDTTGAHPDSARADTILVPAPRRPSFSPRKFIARLGSITTEARFVQGSGYSRLRGTPSVFYIVGVTQDPGLSDSTGRVTPAFGNTSGFSDEWGGSATANVDMGFGAVAHLKADLGGRRTEQNRVTTRSRRILFPQLSFEYGRIPDLVLLSKLLRNPMVQTSYSRSQNTEWANRDDPTLIATSSEWKPLIKVRGDLRNGTQVETNVERRVTQREDKLFVNTLTTDRNTDLSLSFTRRYSSGQKVKVFGKESTVRTSVSWALTTSYSKRSGETLTRSTGRIQGRTEADRLSVNVNGSYGFSSNVTGNLDLGYLQDRNIETRITNRSVRVEARAQFTF